MKLPDNTYWVITKDGEDSYTLHGPTRPLRRGRWKLTKIHGPRPLSELLHFIRWVDDGCPDEVEVETP